MDEPTRIVAIRRRGAPARVYNLRIAVDHAYFANGVLVHNCDDPHNVLGAQSDAERKTTLEWWDEGMSTRANDPKTAAKIVIMQRLHAEDLTGHLLEKGSYDHLCLPTLFEPDHPHLSRTSLRFIDPRTEPGELLSPGHFGIEAVEEAQVALGTFGFLGQHQQRPAPKGGTIFRREWFRFYKALPPRLEEEAQSWDLTFKGKDGATGRRAELARVREPDFVVGDDWGRVGANVYLIDETRGQWEFKEALRQAVRFVERHPNARAKLIEDKANGPALMSMLRDSVPGLLEVEPEGSKIQRAYAVQAFVEAGNVWLPDPSIAPWVNDWLAEVCAFPFGKHDDRVDTLTQILIRWNVNELAANLRRLRALGKM